MSISEKGHAPTGNDAKLTSEIRTEQNLIKSFFLALWAVNAVTTFLFGMSYIDGVWAGVLFFIPLTPYAMSLISSLLGGASALIVLDVAYKKWHKIALLAETNTQFRVAKFGEYTAFVFSLIFTAIVLITTAFSGLVNSGLVNFLDMVGAGSFVFVTVVHLICAYIFTNNSTHQREYTTQVKIAGNAQTESLALQENVMRLALVQARENTSQVQEMLVTAQANIFTNNLLAQFNTVHQIEPNAVVIDAVTEGAAQPPHPNKGLGFDMNQVPVTHPRTYSKTCMKCDNPFTASRANARYCSQSCRQSAHRSRNG